MIEAISAIKTASAASALVNLTPTPAPLSAASTTFLQAMGRGLASLNQSMNAADSAILQAASGKAISPHELMVTLERSRFELQFAVEVRNRALEAYQEVIRMQV
jgi:flagellar hook-basal body complex protein FliE